jgi:hypothetical protein
MRPVDPGTDHRAGEERHCADVALINAVPSGVWTVYRFSLGEMPRSRFNPFGDGSSRARRKTRVQSEGAPIRGLHQVREKFMPNVDRWHLS